MKVTKRVGEIRSNKVKGFFQSCMSQALLTFVSRVESSPYLDGSMKENKNEINNNSEQN